MVRKKFVKNTFWFLLLEKVRYLSKCNFLIHLNPLPTAAIFRKNTLQTNTVLHIISHKTTSFKTKNNKKICYGSHWSLFDLCHISICDFGLLQSRSTIHMWHWSSSTLYKNKIADRARRLLLARISSLRTSNAN